MRRTFHIPNPPPCGAPCRYSPRGGMLILDAQYTEAGRPPAERFVAEEYILDLLNSWDGYRWGRHTRGEPV